MLNLKAKIRENEDKTTRKKAKVLRKKGFLPAVIYGPKLKAIPLEVELKEFEKVYQEAGESSLINLQLPEIKKEYPVLIHEIQKNPLLDRPIHIDFYQASLTEEVEAKVPLIFEGTPPAIKELGGTLVKNFSELEIKALPQNLPKEIKIEIKSLKTFEDKILIKDLKIAKEIKILKEADEIVAWVAPPEKVEEELEKPPEEKVEEVEVIEKEKKEKMEEKEPSSAEPARPSGGAMEGKEKRKEKA